MQPFTGTVAMRHGNGVASLLGMSQVMLAAGLWATVGIATQIVPDASALSAAAFGACRMALGGLAILCIAWFVLPDFGATLRHLEPGRLATFALSSATFQVCLFQSFTLLGVTATVVATVCLPPILATLGSWLRGGATLTGGTVCALCLAVAGVLLFVRADLSLGTDTSRGWGFVLATIASIAFVCMSVAARHLTNAAGPLPASGVGLCLSSLVLALTLPFLGPEAGLSPSLLSGDLLILLIYLGLGPTALAYLLYCSGLAKCRTTNVGLLASMIEPAIAAVLDYVVLQETLRPNEMLGCGLIVMGMLCLGWSERQVVRPGNGIPACRTPVRTPFSA